jgi:hypothetical protein
MTNSQQEFENLVQDILRQNNFRIILSEPPEPGFDFQADLATTKYAVEVKHYRSIRSIASLISSAGIKLAHAASKRGMDKAMLVVSSYIQPELRLALESKSGVIFVDRSDLNLWSSSSPELAQRLAAIVEQSEADETSGGPARSPGELNKLSTGLVLDVIERTYSGGDLCKELKKLDAGKRTWKKYEKLCEKIIKYLFSSDLKNWKSQQGTKDGLNYFDLICRIDSQSAFWGFLSQHLNSRYVVFEFKNYTDEIKQGQILTTEKYLYGHGLRRVGIILTRKGFDAGAQMTIQGAMRDQGKLMIVLNDDQVCELLHKKDSDEDPSDYLFELVDNFLMSLAR